MEEESYISRTIKAAEARWLLVWKVCICWGIWQLSR